MKATGKMSRNASRKAAYSGQADKGSRNEHAIEKPYVGQLVEEVRLDERGRSHRNVRVVHDEDLKDKTVLPAAVTPEGNVVSPKIAFTKNVGGDKRRRQESAWARCKHAPKHFFNNSSNCGSCGCPTTEVK